MRTKALQDAQRRYNGRWIKTVTIKLHRKNDKDIIAALEASGNMQGYIKNLIRAEIFKKKG